MNLKKWSVAPLNKDNASHLMNTAGVPQYVAILLDVRGVTSPEAVDCFLNQTDSGFCDPMVFRDMDLAVERIHQGLENGERIAVYGDYDADGVTATVILYSYLETLGADVVYYIPDRETEGYGMNCDAIRTLAEDGVTLLITVDNGVSAVEEVDYAKMMGMDVVITDHHRPREVLPNAVAVVDPHRTDCPSVFKEYAGVGVAFKLIEALEGEDCDREGLLENYADLITIGTIGDVVSLTGENRLLVQRGLRYMAHSDRIGLRALMERADVMRGYVSANDVAYGIVPRINATGRMDSSRQAVELLLCDDLSRAEWLAEEVCRNNDERKNTEQQILEKTAELLRKEPERLNERILIVEGEGWHHGVIGIVASRLLDQYGKPCIVISYDEEEAKGSGRSVEGLSLFDAIHKNGQLLTKYGGHPMAAGFSLKKENIPALRKALQEYAAELPQIPAQTVHLDCRLRLDALSLDIPHQIQELEPFGTDNPQPLFGLFGVTLEEVAPVGNGKHQRLRVSKNGVRATCILFGKSSEEFAYCPGDVLDLAVQLTAKEYRGKDQLSIIVRDIRVAGFSDEELLQDYDLFGRYKRREPLTAAQADRLLPTREDFALVYRYVYGAGGWNGHLLSLLRRLGADLSLCRLLVILQALHQLRLARCQKRGEGMQITLLPVEKKADLMEAPILKEIQRLKKEAGKYAQ